MDYEYINKVPHYNRDGAIECIDEMVLIFGAEKTATFCLLNCWKYRYRAGEKPGEEAIRDLKKSDWYMNKYKELKKSPCGYGTITTLNPNAISINPNFDIPVLDNSITQTQTNIK